MAISTKIYTDGSSRGNPGPGGWGVLLIQKPDKDLDGRVVELGGRENHTTNNRMELVAAHEALLYIETHHIEGSVTIFSDSSYVLQGITGWVHAWEKNGWRTKTGDEVLNKDLWEQLSKLYFRLKARQTIRWEKVGGHVGIFGNERTDEIATSYADGITVPLFSGSFRVYEKYYPAVANAFSLHTHSISRPKTKTKGPGYSYVSLVDGVIAVDATWDLCKKRTAGKAGARYKKVMSKQEEDELIKEWKG